MDMTLPVSGCDVKVAVFAVDGLDPMVLANLQVVMLSGATVVLQRLQARGLHERTGKRDVTDLQQFRSSEKRHVSRIVEDRIDQAPLLDDEGLESSFLSFDRAGQTGG